jgi:serine/threonine protein kinase/Tfp pilus assembly protein PilF
MIGKTISHYRILEKLGEGGMGVLYKAEDTRLKRTVALKFLGKHLTAEKEAKDRFIQEAQTASAVNHINIATIYEIDELQGECFICMEYIGGKSLKQIIQEKPLSLKEFFGVAVQAADGLAAAHKKGIIHRDIKSDNIMITQDGVVKITDFGLAKLRDASILADNGTISGTLEYMSPEQAQGLASDLRSDIFSLGVVMYEMITRQMPFKGDHQAALIYSILVETPEPLAKYKAGISDELQEIIDKTLHKDVQARYQHTDEVLADLRRLQKDPDLWYEDKIKKMKEQKPSVAVLYLENLSGRKEEDYFVAGMTEDIITDLISIQGIKVLSRSDVLPFRGKRVNIKEIGKKLSVDYVLEGSVRKADDKLRINAQLMKTVDGSYIWAERFDRGLKDIFALQAEVSRKIALSLRVKLSPSEIVQIEKTPTSSIQAYDYYLQGRDYYWKLGKKDIEFAIKLYEKALQIDPDYALAYAGLADALVYKYEAYYDRSLLILNEAEKSSQKALSLDPELPEAHRSLGRVYMFKKMALDAIVEFKKATELRPNCYEAYRALGWIYEEARNYDEAIKWSQKVLEIRPTDKEAFLLLGITYYDQQLYDLALESFYKALDLAPDYSTAFYYIGSTFLRLGEFAQALEGYQKCVETGGDPNVFLDLGWTYLLKKDFQNSLESFQKSIDLGYFDFLAFYSLGLVHKQLKKNKQAEECYKKAIQLCSRQLESDPENPYLHSTLGLAYLALGEEGKAEKEVKISKNLAPKNGAILYDLARFYALRKDEEKSIELLKQALKLPLSPSKFEIGLDPHFRNLQKSSSFAELIKSSTADRAS